MKTLTNTELVNITGGWIPVAIAAVKVVTKVAVVSSAAVVAGGGAYFGSKEVITKMRGK